MALNYAGTNMKWKDAKKSHIQKEILKQIKI